jgi:hypothetical protein
MSNKINRNTVLSAAMVLVVLGFGSLASGQTKRKPAPKPAPVPLSVAETKAGAVKVSNQLKNVSRFIFLLGSVATGIENLDKDIKAGKASRAIAAQNQENKQKLVLSIQGLRQGLTALESEFQSSLSLRRYTLQLGGIANIAATAEDQARAGQLNSAGQTLLTVIEKLTDTLVAMP